MKRGELFSSPWTDMALWQREDLGAEVNPLWVSSPALTEQITEQLKSNTIDIRSKISQSNIKNGITQGGPENKTFHFSFFIVLYRDY